MTFTELEEKWGVQIQILHISPHPKGRTYQMALFVHNGERGDTLREPVEIEFSLLCLKGHVFDWREAIYSLAGDLKLLRINMSYTEFCQALRSDPSLEETRMQYQVLESWLRRINEAFPPSFIQDMQYLLIPNMITPSQETR